MTDRPWETEPNSLEFEADGLPCAMWRNYHGVWCGYVGVGTSHPLFGLPTNHPLKLPSSWFDGRPFDQGVGPMDLFIHMFSGAKSMEDACPISLAFHVHGGVSYADDHVPDHEPDDHWWFGFDCGHAGDYAPAMAGDKNKMMNEMIDSMPEEARATMRNIVFRDAGVYRDQQYVVGECQSLAAQLNAVVGAITKEVVNGRTDDRRD
jgi:hypothetical protein